MTTTRFAYLLWDHGEFGPDWIAATDDKEKVMSMFDAYEAECACGSPAIRARLTELLREPDAVRKEKLARGWGVLHFQIVEMT